MLRCEALEDRRLMSVNPNVLWANYLGGTLPVPPPPGKGPFTAADKVAVDAAGNIFVAGNTTCSNLPQATNASYGGSNNAHDAFVAKLTSSGSLLWVTYLGGSGNDGASGISVDVADNTVVVTGNTTSSDFAGATGTLSGTSDAFVAKVDGTTGAQLWATYVGGSGSDSGSDVAVDSAGNAFVTGCTSSSDLPLATNAYHGSDDGFVAEVNAGGALVWTTYVGGSSYGIALDTSGNILVSGNTLSSNFQGANNLYNPIDGNGSSTTFVAKLNSAGALVWATYVNNADDGMDIAVDGAGNALVVGSEDLVCGTTANEQVSVSKISSTGALAWTTYLGGSGFDYADGIAVDGAGNALVTGMTQSSDFVGTNNSYSGGVGSIPEDAFIAKVSSAGSLCWANYLGGTGNDMGTGIAIDGAGNAVVTGFTTSTDFTGASNQWAGGIQDAYILKFAPPAWAYSTYTTSPNAKINDVSTVTSSITVAASYPIVDVNVSVTITHPSDSDLSLALVAPDGTKVPLVNAATISGANLTGTVLDDQALSPITAGTAPYTGNFRPASPLSALIGKNTSGTWKLQVTDNVKNKLTGTLKSWALDLLYQIGQTQGAAMAMKATTQSSATLTDAALASYFQQSQDDWLNGKKSPAKAAVDLALLEMAR